jgi:hypothetical protein
VQEQGWIVGPGQHIGPASELVVLIRVVDSDVVAVRVQATRLPFTHDGMHDVIPVMRMPTPPTPVAEFDLQIKTKRHRQPCIGLK